jgi:glutamine amidotransferase
MNCNVPTDICFSFEGFARRGGETDEHKDGWGIAFFEGKGCRTFMDVQPSADSVVSDLVKHYPIRSMNVIAHIRKASVGAVRLENTHPFSRELWGEYWVFAHNGDLLEYAPELTGCYQPVGTTDSERAFCVILEHLRQRFAKRPPIAGLCKAIREKVRQIVGFGTFNFLLSNGEILIAHCSTDLHYLIRRHPFDKAELKDLDVTVDFTQVTTPQDRVAVIATEPLTANEEWTRIAPGECMIFHNGDVVECYKD